MARDSKIKGAPGAVGYWGLDIHKRIDVEQIPQKIRVLLQDKLLSRGKKIYLWQSVTTDTPRAFLCSCFKDTTKSSDVACNSCYGTTLVPGYLRFGYETLFMSSVSPNSYLINTVVDTDIKPNRIVLDSGQLNGSVTSVRMQFANPSNLDWDFKVDAVNILETNMVTTSFSTNGIDFYPIHDINTPGKKPVGIGGLYLRVSLARADVEDRSPEFEMIRVRHPKKTKNYIQILRPQVNEVGVLAQYGKRTERMGERFWTMPLDFFDESIIPNTPAARIGEQAIYQRIDGINSTARFVMTKFSYNEEFGIFTHQSFEPRVVQPEEVFTKLVF